MRWNGLIMKPNNKRKDGKFEMTGDQIFTIVWLLLGGGYLVLAFRAVGDDQTLKQEEDRIKREQQEKEKSWK